MTWVQVNDLGPGQRPGLSEASLSAPRFAPPSFSIERRFQHKGVRVTVDTPPHKTTNKHIISEETKMVQRHDQDIWSNCRALRKARILFFSEMAKTIVFLNSQALEPF